MTFNNNKLLGICFLDAARRFLELNQPLNMIVAEEGGVRKRAGDRVREGLEVLPLSVYQNYSSTLPCCHSLCVVPCLPEFDLFCLHLCL